MRDKYILTAESVTVDIDTHQDAPWEQTDFAAALAHTCGLKKHSER